MWPYRSMKAVGDELSKLSPAVRAEVAAFQIPFEGFRIFEKIGGGGFCTVYRGSIRGNKWGGGAGGAAPLADGGGKGGGKGGGVLLAPDTPVAIKCISSKDLHEVQVCRALISKYLLEGLIKKAPLSDGGSWGGTT